MTCHAVIGFLFSIPPGFFGTSFSERGDKIESRAKRELSLSILSPTVDLSTHFILFTWDNFYYIIFSVMFGFGRIDGNGS